MNPQSQAQGASPAHRGSREPVHSQGCRAASLRRPRWVNSNQLSPLLQGGSEPQDGGKAGEPAEGGIECATPPNPPSLPVHWGTLGKSQPLLALFPNWKWKGADKLARTNSEFLPTPIILFQEEQAGDLGNFGAQMKMCKAWGWGGSGSY